MAYGGFSTMGKGWLFLCAHSRKEVFTDKVMSNPRPKNTFFSGATCPHLSHFQPYPAIIFCPLLYCLLEKQLIRSNLTVMSWRDPKWLLSQQKSLILKIMKWTRGWVSVLHSALRCFSLAIMETEGEIIASTTHTFSTMKNKFLSGWVIWEWMNGWMIPLALHSSPHRSKKGKDSDT